MSGNMMVMQYASKFVRLLRFTLDFVASERLKKVRRVDEGLTFYIRN